MNEWQDTADWQYAVANAETELGRTDWIKQRDEAAADDE